MALDFHKLIYAEETRKGCGIGQLEFMLPIWACPDILLPVLLLLGMALSSFIGFYIPILRLVIMVIECTHYFL